MTPSAPGALPVAEGVLVIDKPAGPTSHDVVARVRRLFSTRRVGHAGTLDPPATGVLLVGLGRATRLLRFLQGLEKVYTATVVFGVSTTTQDATGEVVERRPCSFSADELHAEAHRFVGDIEQLPPMVSAVKVGGEPLYRAARRGEVVERAPRSVRVHDLTVEAYDPAGSTAEIRVRCSSGTYVRTLASDLGDRLGCGAHLSALRRLAIGSFVATEAVSLDVLESIEGPERRARLVPMPAALRDFPSVSVGGAALDGVRNGRPLELERPPGGKPVAVLDPAGELVAVYEPAESGGSGDSPGWGGTFRPAAVLAAATEAMKPAP
jgi:tRNA pseudouridine55 synthase